VEENPFLKGWAGKSTRPTELRECRGSIRYW